MERIIDNQPGLIGYLEGSIKSTILALKDIRESRLKKEYIDLLVEGLERDLRYSEKSWNAIMEKNNC